MLVLSQLYLLYKNIKYDYFSTFFYYLIFIGLCPPNTDINIIDLIEKRNKYSNKLQNKQNIFLSFLKKKTINIINTFTKKSLNKIKMFLEVLDYYDN